MLDVGKLIEALELPVRTLAGLTLATGLLLFGPETFISRMGLAGFLEDYRTWIGLTFLVSASTVLVAITGPLWSVAGSELRQRWVAFRHRGHLKRLTPGEKEVLRGYLEADTRTRHFWLGEGNVRELEAHGILRRASNVGSSGAGFPFNVQPWAWDYLQKHPELLEE